MPLTKKQALGIALDMLLGGIFNANADAIEAWKKANAHLTIEQQVELAKKECFDP